MAPSLARLRNALTSRLLLPAVAFLPACTATLSAPGSGEGPSVGAAGTASVPGSGDATQAPSAASAAVPSGMRRLTADQYRTTINELFGSAVTAPHDLEPDDTNARFAITGSYRVTTGPKGVAKYEAAASDIAAQVFASPELKRRVVGCDPAGGPTCARAFVTSFGRRAWRRPLTEAEILRYQRLVSDATAAGASADEALSLALRALLQSPYFIYMPELGESVGSVRRFTGYETATRLAYLLTESPPDPELAAAADAGELSGAAGISRQVTRLLASPKSHAALASFWGQLFGTRELAEITKSSDVFPSASPALLRAMQQELASFIEDQVFAKRGAALDILDAKTRVTDSALAALYGDVPERVGVLTTGGWLSLQAKPDRTSPTLRGVWVREPPVVPGRAPAAGQREQRRAKPTIRDDRGRHELGSARERLGAPRATYGYAFGKLQSRQPR